jgi:UDP-3-O-[3-hydroxymyristoyl] N-acetylglucosamine deacetylase
MGYTLQKETSIESIGIHSGQLTKIKIIPYNKGIIFIHKKTNTEIALNYRNLYPKQLGNNLCKDNICIRTIEHLCAVLWAVGITDAKIELEGDEIPITDGSGRLFWEKLIKIKKIKVNNKPKVIYIKEPFIRFYDNDSFLMAFPDSKLSINYTINFPNAPTKSQNYIFQGKEYFEQEILPARTFGNISDLEELNSKKLSLGASLDNCLGYNNKHYLNNPRFENEEVRHKILDLLGDIYSSGYELIGKIIAYKTSHIMNVSFMKEGLEGWKLG